MKGKGKKTNSNYQELNKTSARTILKDLENFLSIGILKRIGEMKGAYYELELGGYGG